MAAFEWANSPGPVRSNIVEAQGSAWDRLAAPGARWSGSQRVAIAAEARQAQPVAGQAEAVHGALPAHAIEAVRRIALDAHRIDRDWAERMVSALGDAAYVELVALTVQVTAIDAFAQALGVAEEPLPEPRPGEPGGMRPEGLGDIGAFVPCLLAAPGPNVGRALSLAPRDNQTFFELVGSMYAMSDFMELVWKDRPLSRPQVELVAARVSAINECFY